MAGAVHQRLFPEHEGITDDDVRSALPLEGSVTDTSRVEFCARLGAALRAIEMLKSPPGAAPMIEDPLALACAGPEALAAAETAWLSELPPGADPAAASSRRRKHTHAAIRARAIDERLSWAVNITRCRRSSDRGLQLVNLGAGLDTRPWRLLRTIVDLHGWVWFDVDLAEVMLLKRALLQQAGAQLSGGAVLSGVLAAGPAAAALARNAMTVDTPSSAAAGVPPGPLPPAVDLQPTAAGADMPDVMDVAPAGAVRDAASATATAAEAATDRPDIRRALDASGHLYPLQVRSSYDQQHILTASAQ